MKTALRSIIFTLGTVLAFTACDNASKTEAQVQARLDAEKVKQLSAELESSKAQVDLVRKENDDLKAQVAALKAGAQKTAEALPKPQQKVAAKKPGEKAPERNSPEAETLKKEVTGGSSFK